ncbi:prolipoprotein diacylglyceryl transferase [Lachnospiraceae bacterium MD335]|nr:prolipoprotein diacylglyceryl transferase [Lachnospiraceae bacterium MD335]
MYPSLKLFGCEIYLYHICAMTAFLAAIFVFQNRTKNVFRPEVQDDIIAMAGTDILFIIAGASLHNKFLYAASLRDFFHILFVDTGIAFLGGLLGGLLGFLILFPVFIGKRIKRIEVMNAFVPSVIIGHAIGRIGCLLGGCCYGKPSKWGIIYKAGTPAYQMYGAEKLFPVPLAETVLLLILLLIVLKIGKKPVSIYLLGYSVIRFCLEFIRGDDRGGTGFLSPAQKICTCILIITIGVHLFNCLFKNKGYNLDSAISAALGNRRN